MTEREKLMKAFASSRGNLLLAIAFTAANTLLYLFHVDFYFLFSAFIPMFTAGMGYTLYQQTGAAFVFVIGAAIAVLILLVYLLCYLFSKKGAGWLVAALVLFSADTLVYLLIGFSTIGDSGFDLSIILDLIFHVWVVFSLITGVRAAFLLKKLPPDPSPPAGEVPVPTVSAAERAEAAIEGKSPSKEDS